VSEVRVSATLEYILQAAMTEGSRGEDEDIFDMQARVLGELGYTVVNKKELSMLLFLAREQIAMWGDVVEQRVGRRDVGTDNIRDSIDQFRKDQGWDPDGFGDE
jgi:hypothetical protein